VTRKECSVKTMVSSMIDHSTLFQHSHQEDILTGLTPTTLLSRQEMDETANNGGLTESPRPLDPDKTTNHGTFRAMEDQGTCTFIQPTVTGGRNSSTMNNISSIPKTVEHLMLKVAKMLKALMSLFGRDMKVLTRDGK